MGGVIHVRPHGARLDPNEPLGRVDVHAVHRREVDDERVVPDAEATGVVTPAADSDAYFASRPWQSRLGAWASAQSQPVASRSQLKDSLLDAARRFGTPSPDTAGAESAGNIPVPRPPHWGGYQLWVEKLELWVEGEARIHDRARWSRTLQSTAAGAFDPGPWTSTRLQP